MSTALGPDTAHREPAASPPAPRQGAAPLKPPCALKIGIAGNRRFAGETDEAPSEAAVRMKRQAAAGCTGVWQAIVEAMRSVRETEVAMPAEHQRTDDRLLDGLRLADFYRPGNPRLAVLCSLAAGADQIGAAAALDVGRNATDVDIELEAVLPFPGPDYPGGPRESRPEFRPDEAATVASLAAAARQVVRLDGDYADALGRSNAYRDARDMVLQHADMLLAVCDPWAEGRPAGTLETVERALAAGIPVIALLVAENDARIAVYLSASARPATPDDEWASAGPLGDGAWRGEVAEAVAMQLALPHQRPVDGETGRERKQRLESLAETVNRLRLLYGEAPPHRWCRGAVRRFVFAAAWRWALRFGAFFSRPSELAGDMTEAAPPFPRTEAALTHDEITMAPYAAYYHRASELAGAYMRTYRGAFILAFTLAGVAVFAAVMLMVASHPDVAGWLRATAGSADHWIVAGAPPFLATVVLGGAKIGIIVFLLVLEHVSHQARYQEHATDFRYLAEKLRPMQWLAPAGTLVPAVDLPAYLAPHDPRRGWMPWLVRAVARGNPPVTVTPPDAAAPHDAAAPVAGASPREVSLDARSAQAALERAASQWLEGQLRYHADHARRMHGLDEGLERFAKILLWAVLVLAGAAFLLKLTYPLGLFSPGQTPLLLGALAAFLPAFIAALGGIMFQSEARRLRSRSEAMYHVLRARQRDLRQQVAALATDRHRQRGVAWAVALHLRDLARTTIEETGDWKVLYEAHEIHAG